MATAQAVGTMTDGKLERYRAAEQALWAEHGLEPREHVVEVPELRARIRVVEVGSGQPIIFVPGTGGIGPYWAPLVQQLGGFRCLLVDRPGWGPSDPVDYPSRRGRAALPPARAETGSPRPAHNPASGGTGCAAAPGYAAGRSARKPRNSSPEGSINHSPLACEAHEKAP